jgi:N-acetylneuraminate synthase/N,N'-diacetyllegionaminate synthase
MGTMDEVNAARDAVRDVNPDGDIAFLHCTSSYPCDISDVNLRAMETMAAEIEEPVGYSDHTTRIETPALAVAAGAPLVLNRFTLDSTLPGPDHEASLEPPALTRAVDLVEDAVEIRGRPEKEPIESELENRQVARKSLHAAAEVLKGTKLTESNVAIVRPADGISPSELSAALGKRVNTTLREGEPIKPIHLDDT